MRSDQAEALSMLGGLEILSVPVVSTGHLTHAEAKRRGEEWPVRVYFESLDGFVLPTSGPAPSEAAWPGWLRVQAWARGAGYEWVMLSPDGAEVPGLEVYPW